MASKSAVTIDNWAQGGKLFKCEITKYNGQKAYKLTVGPASLNPKKFKPDLVVFKNQDNQIHTAIERAFKQSLPVRPCWPISCNLAYDSSISRLTVQFTAAIWQNKKLEYKKVLTGIRDAKD